MVVVCTGMCVTFTQIQDICIHTYIHTLTCIHRQVCRSLRRDVAAALNVPIVRVSVETALPHDLEGLPRYTHAHACTHTARLSVENVCIFVWVQVVRTCNTHTHTKIHA